MGAPKSRKPLYLWSAFTLIVVSTFLLNTLLFGAPNISGGNPKISWTPTALNVSVTAGASNVFRVSFVATENINNAVFWVAPELQSFVKVSPSTLASIAAGQTMPIDVIVATPPGTPQQTVSGTIHLRNGSGNNKTFPAPFNVKLTPTTNSVSLLIPTSFQLNDEIAAGGPINLNNFGNIYVHGGFVPSGGASIDVTDVPIPQIPILDFIANELQGASITSSNSAIIAGTQAREVFYTDEYGSGISYRNVAVYIPIGSVLHKIYLTYHADDVQEADFLSAFQLLLSNIQFNQ